MFTCLNVEFMAAAEHAKFMEFFVSLIKIFLTFLVLCTFLQFVGAKINGNTFFGAFYEKQHVDNERRVKFIRIHCVSCSLSLSFASTTTH